MKHCESDHHLVILRSTLPRPTSSDFGYGDLRDILAGIDAAEAAAPIDPSRLGITGGSYGGYMTMWAVTQTHRFKAAVAAAGIGNWQCYYGQNGIDQWMIPYFGKIGLRRPGGLCPLRADHLHQERQHADAGLGRRPGHRVPRRPRRRSSGTRCTTSACRPRSSSIPAKATACVRRPMWPTPSAARSNGSTAI